MISALFKSNFRRTERPDKSFAVALRGRLKAAPSLFQWVGGAARRAIAGRSNESQPLRSDTICPWRAVNRTRF